MKIFSKRCIIPIEDNHLLKIEQSSFIGKDEDEAPEKPPCAATYTSSSMTVDDRWRMQVTLMAAEKQEMVTTVRYGTLPTYAVPTYLICLFTVTRQVPGEGFESRPILK